jgi:transketolase
LKHIFDGTIPVAGTASLPDFSNTTGSLATRSASGQVLNVISQQIPWFMGGSADLGPSTNTLIKDQDDFSAVNYGGRNLRFGVREAAMAAIANGMANAGLRPYAATFLVFSDYARPAIRLSALMQLPVLYIFTHDSISVGEDGPTHQPVEHLAALRAIPGLTVIRPADAAEVSEAYKAVLAGDIGPAAVILSRQKLPVIDRKRFSAASGLHRGAYIIADTSGSSLPDVILIATGSEVRLIIDAYCSLAGNNLKIRLVSMPSWELFDRQPETYRNSILPPDVTRRIVVEQGIAMGWERYTGNNGLILSINSFGKSAPGPVLEEQFGFTSSRVIEAVKTIMK